MKDLTIHRDFSDQRDRLQDRHNRLPVVSDKELNSILDLDSAVIPEKRKLKFKNDVAQGTRKERTNERKAYNEEHYFGHECERCGKKIGVIPGDSDGLSLCKRCSDMLELKVNEDFVVKGIMKD